MTKTKAPPAVMTMRPVDGGRAVIGSIDCPNCGKEHLTTVISTGERRVFCGVVDEENASSSGDGWTWIDIQTIG